MEKTMFLTVYDRFLGKITDDMYMELTPLDTLRDLQNILLEAIPMFEFPRINIYDYQSFELSINELTNEINDESCFFVKLTAEEINILATLMKLIWLKRQIASIENIRMKYSGSDFKFTSQASHLGKLITLQETIEKEDRHNQRLYKRRKFTDEGMIKSNWSVLNSSNVLDD